MKVTVYAWVYQNDRLREVASMEIDKAMEILGNEQSFTQIEDNEWVDTLGQHFCLDPAPITNREKFIEVFGEETFNNLTSFDTFETPCVGFSCNGRECSNCKFYKFWNKYYNEH